MPVEGRDDEVIGLTIVKHFASYFPGEAAAFLPEHAQELIDRGVAVQGGPGDPPVNLDVPFASQEADAIHCTMGNWTGEPTGYAYAWQSDGADIGDGTNPYALTAGDFGKTITCVVTATNDAGSTAAPASNGVVAIEPPAAEGAAHSRRRTRS